MAVMLTGCPHNVSNKGHFKEIVTNFEVVNSRFDDYNSDAPYLYHQYHFNFSSNKNSAGQDFDIIGGNTALFWDKVDKTLTVEATQERLLPPVFDIINTPCNEMGPYSFGYYQSDVSSDDNWVDLLLYANDCDGHYDIQFIYCKKGNFYDTATSVISQPQKISFLNTSGNELYPTFYCGGLYHMAYEWIVEPDKIEKILYCSDKEGNFDIYEVTITPDSDIIGTLESNESQEPVKLAVNSTSDDKCVFVNGNLMVFTSDRSGGYGGFDLYYSYMQNGEWTEPVNFGDRINSEYDEYRPITLKYYDFDNILLVFSSNRPGGRGGFDLYYTGINQELD